MVQSGAPSVSVGEIPRQVEVPVLVPPHPAKVHAVEELSSEDGTEVLCCQKPRTEVKKELQKKTEVECQSRNQHMRRSQSLWAESTSCEDSVEVPRSVGVPLVQLLMMCQRMKPELCPKLK